jgi:hypothetical protein
MPDGGRVEAPRTRILFHYLPRVPSEIRDWGLTRFLVRRRGGAHGAIAPRSLGEQACHAHRNTVGDD